MPRPNYEYSFEDEGKLEIKKNKQGYSVIFTPPEDAIPRGHDPEKEFKIPIAFLNKEKTFFTFFPFKGRGLYSMQPKYLHLGAITIPVNVFSEGEPEISDIQGIFENVPDVFIENYNFGLGFLKKYHAIASVIETLQAEHLYILNDEPTSFDKDSKKLIIHINDLRTLQRTVDRIVARAVKVASSTKKDAVTETLLEYIGKSAGYSSVLGKTDISERISKNTLLPLTEASRQKQSHAADIVTANSRKMLKEQPGKLVKLRQDIDLVTLDELITKYSEMIEQDLDEYHWQQLFEQNPFILNLAFGVPIIKVRGNAYVGGRKIQGGGDKIADFLVKNSISNNAAIIEIKKPSTRLLGASTYRKDVHAPSTELSGATNQLLDQINKFQRSIATLKDESQMYDLESYSVVGVLVIGRSSQLQAERKSFELFRGNSKNITMLTFDELLEKLRQLKKFLGTEDYPSNNHVDGEDDPDLPF